MLNNEELRDPMLDRIQHQSVENDQLEIIRQNWIRNKPLGVSSSIEKFVDLQISVIDTGVGMSEEGVSKLFIDFNKLDENSQRREQASGYPFARGSSSKWVAQSMLRVRLEKALSSPSTSKQSAESRITKLKKELNSCIHLPS